MREDGAVSRRLQLTRLPPVSSVGPLAGRRLLSFEIERKCLLRRSGLRTITGRHPVISTLLDGGSTVFVEPPLPVPYKVGGEALG